MLLVEKINGKPLSTSIRERTQMVGFSLLVFLMILSTMSGLSGSVSASATNDDLAIESSVHPLQDTHYDFSRLIFPKVIVTNEFFVSANNRQNEKRVHS